MSLTRRLRRIARAHFGALRDGSPSRRGATLENWDWEVDEGLGDDRFDEVSASTDAADEALGDVPPEVARAYRALEVPVGSSRRTVKKGYRRVMKKYHQDRFDEDPERRDVAGEVSKRLNQAYQTVMNYLDEHGH